MQINLYATLRLAAGVKMVEMRFDNGPQVRTVLLELVERYPVLWGQLFDLDGQLYTCIHLFLNRKDITYLPDGLQTILKPEDTLDIFPALSGG